MTQWQWAPVPVLGLAAWTLLVGGNAISPSAETPLEERLMACAGCHGETGNSKLERVPSLAGQPALFTISQLILMREKVRRVEQMAPFVADITDSEIQALAAYYAKQKPERSEEPIDAALAARGAEVAETLLCGTCHLPDYSGREQIPRLAKQRIDYLIQALKAYRDNRRAGSDTSMNAMMYGMSDDDIVALAHFLASR
jgi:cytochrome c553